MIYIHMKKYINDKQQINQYVYTYIYTYTFAHTDIYVHSICIYIHIHICVCIYIYVSIYICVDIHVYRQAFVLASRSEGPGPEDAKHVRGASRFEGLNHPEPHGPLGKS